MDNTTMPEAQLTDQEYADLMYYEAVAQRVQQARELYPDEFRAWKRREVERAQRILAEYGPEFATEETKIECAF